MKCTVVIPTYNRPNYLKRISGYYHQYGSSLPILIADSSMDENKKLNRENLASFQGAFFTYLDKYDPGTDPWYKILDALQQVSTKYCVLCADDDFVTPNGINQSVEFLECNADFTIAHGRYINFRLEGDGTDNRFCWINTYLPAEINAYFMAASTLNHVPMRQSIIFTGALERIHYHLSNYFATFYAVHRTDLLKQILEETVKVTGDYPFRELLSAILELIQGKMKCIDVLYSARDGSSGRSVDPREIKDYTTAEYDEEYAKFKGCLAIHLSTEHGSDMAASEKVIDDAMASYLSYGHKHTLIDKITVVLHYMPDWIYKGARALYRIMFLSGCSSGSSAWMDSYPSSEYVNDFEQIRQIVLLHDCESK